MYYVYEKYYGFSFFLIFFLYLRVSIRRGDRHLFSHFIQSWQNWATCFHVCTGRKAYENIERNSNQIGYYFSLFKIFLNFWMEVLKGVDLQVIVLVDDAISKWKIKNIYIWIFLSYIFSMCMLLSGHMCTVPFILYNTKFTWFLRFTINAHFFSLGIVNKNWPFQASIENNNQRQHKSKQNN